MLKSNLATLLDCSGSHCTTIDVKANLWALFGGLESSHVQGLDTPVQTTFTDFTGGMLELLLKQLALRGSQLQHWRA